jgi:hypothetical protein
MKHISAVIAFLLLASIASALPELRGIVWMGCVGEVSLVENDATSPWIREGGHFRGWEVVLIRPASVVLASEVQCVEVPLAGARTSSSDLTPAAPPPTLADYADLRRRFYSMGRTLQVKDLGYFSEALSDLSLQGGVVTAVEVKRTKTVEGVEVTIARRENTPEKILFPLDI